MPRKHAFFQSRSAGYSYPKALRAAACLVPLMISAAAFPAAAWADTATVTITINPATALLNKPIALKDICCVNLYRAPIATAVDETAPGVVYLGQVDKTVPTFTESAVPVGDWYYYAKLIMSNNIDYVPSDFSAPVKVSIVKQKEKASAPSITVSITVTAP